MNPAKLLTSPLAATAGVLAGMALLAIPLRQLTSATPPAAPPAAPAPSSEDPQHPVPTWLTLKLLAPAKSVTLKTAGGQVLWQLAETEPGDLDTQADLPFAADGLDLTLTADFADPERETAAFLTLAPDGLEEQTRHAIGSGRLEETLRFTWPAR